MPEYNAKQMIVRKRYLKEIEKRNTDELALLDELCRTPGAIEALNEHKSELLPILENMQQQ